MSGFKVVGISEETDCECCGKANLKRTVVLARLDADGNELEFVKFGRDCAARAVRVRWTADRMERHAQQVQAERDEAERRRVHEVGEVRSIRPWVIEWIGNNGGSVTFLALANGLRPAVWKWAEERWPTKEISVRVAV